MSADFALGFDTDHSHVSLPQIGLECRKLTKSVKICLKTTAQLFCQHTVISQPQVQRSHVLTCLVKGLRIIPDHSRGICVLRTSTTNDGSHHAILKKRRVCFSKRNEMQMDQHPCQASRHPRLPAGGRPALWIFRTISSCTQTSAYSRELMNLERPNPLPTRTPSVS